MLVIKTKESKFKNSLYFSKEATSDVICIVDGKKFPAHKWVLSFQSKVFKRMFKSKMVEATTGEIEITDCSSDVFEVFLKYLYTDQCSDPNLKEHVYGLLPIANKYMVDDLVVLCTSSLISSLNVNNAIDTFVTLDQLSLTEAKEIVSRFIVNNIVQMMAETDVLIKAPEVLTEVSKKARLK